MLKKWIPLLLKLLISILLIWYLLRKVDLADVWDKMLSADPLLLILSALVILAQFVICSFRWGAIIRAIAIPVWFLGTLKIVFIGAFFNQLLPSSVGGDAVRIYKIRSMGLSTARAINSVFLERAIVVAVLVLLVLAIQPFFLPQIDQEARGLVLLSLGLVTVAMVVGLVALIFLDQLPTTMHRWRLISWLVLLGADARSVLLNAHSALPALGWTVVGHVNITLAVYFLALSLDLNVTMIDCLALFLPVSLIAIIPISIAGWGIRENAMVVAFGMIGVSDMGATALSLIFGIMIVVTSIPGGLLWFVGSSRRERDLANAGN